MSAEPSEWNKIEKEEMENFVGRYCGLALPPSENNFNFLFERKHKRVGEEMLIECYAKKNVLFR